ncbi:MAG: hypothetical protein IE927_14660 [Rhodobacterales bacterium]|nr:hypothetical protein [Rhodobacterales bacterium]
MTKSRMIPALAAVALLAACAGGDPATRDAGPAGAPLFSIPGTAPLDARTVLLSPKYDVERIRIEVPETLRVSEANVFYPLADIVWRGEAPGNRHDRVRAILADAAGQATAAMTAGPQVEIVITLRRFHALTEKARIMVGGTHAITFDLEVRDAATGAVLEPARRVHADVAASGGAKAMAEDQMGRTQRVVIVEHLVRVLKRELSTQTAVPDVPVSRMDSDLRLTPAASNRL